MVSVVLYGLTYLLFFKLSFQWVSIVFDVSSTVYFRFRNYRITDVVFISDNIVSFSFLMKKCESESDGFFHRSFLTVFIASGVHTISCRACLGVPLLQKKLASLYQLYK